MKILRYSAAPLATIILTACSNPAACPCRKGKKSSSAISIAYSGGPLTVTAGTAVKRAVTITPASAAKTDFTYTIAPALPAGLSINAATGEISGTPTADSPAADYKITAAGKAGTPYAGVTRTATLSITVNAPTITKVAFGVGAMTVSGGTGVDSAITITPPPADKTVFTYTSEPPLPTRLGFADDGTITGKLTAPPSAATDYKITVAGNAGTIYEGLKGTATLSIKVDAAKINSASYSGGPLNATVGTAIRDRAITITPAPADKTDLTYAVTTPTTGLPAGLSINAADGTISGTPTAVSAEATYTITARGKTGTPYNTAAGGAVTGTATLSITVNHGISYGTGALTATMGTTIPPASQRPVTIAPSAATKTDFTYTSNPALPAGITIAADGTIRGTPTAAAGVSSRPYTITARGKTGTAYAGLTATAELTITVNAAPATITSISYGTGLLTATMGTAIPPANRRPVTIAPAAATKTDFTYTSNPALPAGITIAADGTIRGTPTAAAGVSSSISYRITATGKTGTAYAGSTARATLTITVNAASLTSMNFGATPLTVTSGTMYTATAGAAQGRGPTLTPATAGVGDFTYTVTTPTTGLPAGLSFDAATGRIIGTPTAAAPSAAYTIRATGNAGTIYAGSATTTTLQITVNAAPATITSISYGTGTLTATMGTAIPAANRRPVTINPAAATKTDFTYTSTPALPAGITIAADGTIRGTPTAAAGVSSSISYRITATGKTGTAYAGSTARATLTITVNAASLTSMNFGATPLTVTSGTMYTATAGAAQGRGPTLTPATAGVGDFTYTVTTPTTGLPAGLSFDAATGRIIGTPTAAAPSAAYTIRATGNAGTIYAGSTETATLRITVNAAPATITSISYGTGTLTATMGTAIPAANRRPVTINPAAATKTDFTYTSNPALPAGITIAADGTIRGTPTAAAGVSSNISYRITATGKTGTTYAGSTARATLRITVNAASLTSMNFGTTPWTITSGTTYSAAATAGAVQGRGPTLTPTTASVGDFTYAVTTPTTGLPAGLSFDAATGRIIGTPTAAAPSAAYTIRATGNAGTIYAGSTETATLRITVNAAPATITSISYGTGTLTATMGTAIPAANRRPVTINPAAATKTDFTYTSNPALPAGITIAADGTIRGTPTAAAGVSSNISYRITATGKTGTTYAGSTARATLRITVNAASLTSMNFGTTPWTITSGTTYSAAATAGAVQGRGPTLTPTTASVGDFTYAVTTPTTGLPAGLSFDAATGRIIGTPTAAAPSAAYTIRATGNAGTIYAGSTETATLRITVNAAPATITSISYGTGTLTATMGTAIPAANRRPVTIAPAAATKTDFTYTSNPALPAGITIAADGTIRGTPTAAAGVSSNISYRITATGKTGTTYAGSTARATLRITVNAATLTSMNFGTTPWTITSGTTYSAAATAGAVQGRGPTLTPTTASVGDFTYAVTTPTTGLPAGLSFDAATGRIIGTPTAAAPSAAYTIRATGNAGTIYAGSTETATLRITVNAAPATITSISYGTGTLTATMGTAIPAANRRPVTINPAAATKTDFTYTSNPALPAGITIAADGTIRGTPTAAAGVSSNISYRITATGKTGTTYAGSTARATLRITVNAASLTSMNFGTTPWTITSGTTYSAAATAGAVQGRGPTLTPTTASVGDFTYAVTTPTTGLPAGLSFDAATGRIIGTPTAAAPSAAYTIRATGNAGTIYAGSTETATLRITVNAAPATITSISYGTGTLTATMGTAIPAANRRPVTIAPAAATKTDFTYTSNPALPAGITIAADGTIRGTPTAAAGVSSNISYRITATGKTGTTYAGSTARATLRITVNAASLTSMNFGTTPWTITRGTTYRAAATAGAVQGRGPTLTPTTASVGDFTYAVTTPTTGLPAGLSFDAATGRIIGTPTAAAPSAAYTIRATGNAGTIYAGSTTTTTLQITVN